ncbi:uncharacterized protein LOC111701888 [Eurytemora carolleeae]|uniref:uncharacterized protein LOC111701888 n=1 Tax=Eurytemora carolleeae TaxID=1294199 RepID=UPI000C77326E|nr:uncharacterized protein LOC111701888 [Eurytemora carolleeae]|eukprot:XP_023329136.1 uncharacterized protein LOC111701888 [Eurytemora affinis]
MGEISGMHQAVAILVKIGVIHEKANCISRTKTCFWMILSLFLGLGTIYEDMETIIYLGKDVSYLFAVLSTDILLPLQTCLVFPCLGYLVLADNDIIKNFELKAPRRKIHFILFVLASVASYGTLLRLYLFTNSVLFTSCLLVLCCLTEIISVLLIGTITTNLQLNIEELSASRYYTGIIEEYQKIGSRFKNLKKGLGPILLLIFSSRMLSLICVTEFVVKHIFNALLLIFIPSIGLQMFYITSTLDQIFDTFKSNKKSLRELGLRSTKTDGDLLSSLIVDVEDETPFSALDFFIVDKSLLTSVLSTLVTYSIILYQF